MLLLFLVLSHLNFLESGEQLVSDFDNLNYAHAVVNEGESLFCVGDTWTDLTDILTEKDNRPLAK